MKLPYKITIGKKTYEVQMHEEWDKRYFGYIYYNLQRIHVVTHYKGVARKPAAVRETFWHEVTHGILHDMEHPLWRDEKFVTAFSSRLSKMIDSAKFKE